MKLLVHSKVLQISYIVFGGIPALFLAFLCAVYLKGAFWAVLNTEGEEQLKAILITTLFSFSIIGTISGWILFLSLGIKTRTGMVIHGICITAGITAALILTWETIFKDGQVTGLLLPLGPVVVGFLLLINLRKAAQQGAPADAQTAARFGRG